MDEDARAALGRLIEERGEDFSSLSRLIGRNPAYIQQYIRRGTPRRLAEEDRRLLARYFGVDESVLGAPDRPAPAGGGGLVAVPRLDVGASAGAGALDGGEARLGRLGFDPLWLRRLGVSDPARLSLIRVEGDSMAPTLSAGDEILVDQGDAAGRLRDGIYVLRMEDALVVKRIARGPKAVAVRSDNPAYPSWPDCDPAALAIVGRVVWVGRALR
ncbi:MAG: helix-turn-helix transcriptional regulator [Allosphingosinicella sp.]